MIRRQDSVDHPRSRSSLLCERERLWRDRDVLEGEKSGEERKSCLGQRRRDKATEPALVSSVSVRCGVKKYNNTSYSFFFCFLFTSISGYPFFLRSNRDVTRKGVYSHENGLLFLPLRAHVGPRGSSSVRIRGR